MFINLCKQTKRSKPVEKPVVVLRPIKLVKAGTLAEKYPVIAAAMDAKLAEIAEERSIRKAFDKTRREREAEGLELLAQFRRSEPASIGSVRRR